MTSVRLPVASLAGNLIVSIQGGLSDGQVAQLEQDVTRAVEDRAPHGLIIDLSGVDILDSYLTRAIRDLALVARMMGVRAAVCGMRPAVAITLVEMGLEIPGVVSALNLDRAVEALAELAGDDRAAPRIDEDEIDADA
jgi:rsbT antagonist protein RsbS